LADPYEYDSSYKYKKIFKPDSPKAFPSRKMQHWLQNITLHEIVHNGDDFSIVNIDKSDVECVLSVPA
jgi:hypothetical protein